MSAVAVLAVTSALLSATAAPAAAAPAAPPPAMAVADATSSTGLGEYDISTLTTGQLPPRPIVVSTTLDFAPTSSGLTVNGMPFGAAQWKSTGDAGTTLSWLLDLSMAGSTTVTVRVNAAGNAGASYDRTVPVQVASEGRRTAGAMAVAPGRSSASWPGPLQFQYATATTAPVKGLTATPSYKTRVKGDVRRNLSLDAGSGFAVIAENVVDAGIISSRVSGAVGSSSASSLSRVLVRNSWVNGNDNTAVNGSVNVVNSYLTSNQDGVHPLGLNPASTPSVIAYNRIQRNGLSTAGTNGFHNDGVQMWKGSNVVISRNWISGWATSAIMLKTDQLNSDGTPLNHVRIDGNYLATTGYFTLYICSGGQGLPQYVTVTNNVFGPNRSNGASGNVAPADGLKFVRTEAQRTRAVRAGVPGAASWVVWSGNVDARTGAEIAPPGGWLAP